MNEDESFENEKLERILRYEENATLKGAAEKFTEKSVIARYSYNFSWLGRPIIQYPQDMVAVQEIVWKVKPDLIIETGVARGGSVIFSASLLELIGKGKVIGIDIDIRKSNRVELEQHRMAHRISLIEGSSISNETVERVREFVEEHDTVMVFLDSNHTYEHVFSELELYAPFVTVGSYIVVFDTIIDKLPANATSGRPWGRGNNPLTAVRKFLETNKTFEIDRELESKLLVTMTPGGYLKKVM